MPEGAQSPSTNEEQKQLGHSAPGKQAESQLTDAQQRPEQSGNADSKKEPGESGGVSAEALKTAQASADALSTENGQSRKEVETGGKAQ